MGLDMYLSRSKFVGFNYEHKRKELEDLGIVLPDLSFAGIDIKKVTTITEDVMYWRKANAIHKWFVDRVQNGNDDCEEYLVSSEKLEELYNTIKLALSSRDNEEIGNIEDILPTQCGFFFGGTDYDEYYWGDLVSTKEMLEKLFKDKTWDTWDYKYQSSW